MSDLISRQAAIVALDNRMSSLENVDMQIAMRFAKGIIHELPSVTSELRWIPVSERLPKYNKTVLVSVKQKGKEAMVFTAQRRRRVKTPDLFECCMDDEGWWDFRIADWDDHEVIAWMPLPEPYKAESEVRNE